MATERRLRKDTEARDDARGTDTVTREETYCAWVQGVLRCPALAEWFPGVNRRGYCSWHALVRQDPRINVFDEFERWCLKLAGPEPLAILEHDRQQADKPLKAREPRPARNCALWTHYAPLALWQWLHHQRDHLPLATPCHLEGCPHEVVEPLSAAEIAAFRARLAEDGGESLVKKAPGVEKAGDL